MAHYKNIGRYTATTGEAFNGGTPGADGAYNLKFSCIFSKGQTSCYRLFPWTMLLSTNVAPPLQMIILP